MNPATTEGFPKEYTWENHMWGAPESAQCETIAPDGVEAVLLIDHRDKNWLAAVVHVPARGYQTDLIAFDLPDEKAAREAAETWAFDNNYVPCPTSPFRLYHAPMPNGLVRQIVARNLAHGERLLAGVYNSTAPLTDCGLADDSVEYQEVIEPAMTFVAQQNQ